MTSGEQGVCISGEPLEGKVFIELSNPAFHNILSQGIGNQL